MNERLKHVVVGDKVVRMLAGTIPMEMIVTAVDDDIITCSAVGSGIDGWTFSRVTGGEIDESLGWNGIYTGSFLKLN